MGRPDLNRLAQNKDVRAFVNEYVSCSYIFAFTRIVIEVIFDYVARARVCVRVCVFSFDIPFLPGGGGGGGMPGAAAGGAGAAGGAAAAGAAGAAAAGAASGPAGAGAPP